MDETTTILLTRRELTLIRVALIGRLDRLKDKPDREESYEQSRELLNGKLLLTRQTFTA